MDNAVEESKMLTKTKKMYDEVVVFETELESLIYGNYPGLIVNVSTC